MTAFGLDGVVADGGKGALDWDDRSDLLRVFGGKTVVGEQDVSVVDQLGRYLIVFRPTGLDEEKSKAASAFVPACQMSCMWPLTLDCADFGISVSRVPVLWTQQRCSRALPKNSRKGAHDPKAP